MEVIYWSGYSDKDRVEALTDIEKYIKKYGYLADFTSFSGNAVSFKIKIEERNIKLLFDQLREYLRLDDFKMVETDAKIERVVLFNLSFVDRRI